VATIDAPYIVMHATTAWYKLFGIHASRGSYQHMYSIMSLIGRDSTVESAAAAVSSMNDINTTSFSSSNAYVSEWKEKSNGSKNKSTHHKATNALLTEMHAGHTTNNFKPIHGVLCFSLANKKSQHRQQQPQAAAQAQSAAAAAAATIMSRMSFSTNSSSSSGGGSSGRSNSTGGAAAAAAGAAFGANLPGSSSGAQGTAPVQTEGHNLMCTLHVYPIFSSRAPSVGTVDDHQLQQQLQQQSLHASSAAEGRLSPSRSPMASLAHRSSNNNAAGKHSLLTSSNVSSISGSNVSSNNNSVVGGPTSTPSRLAPLQPPTSPLRTVAAAAAVGGSPVATIRRSNTQIPTSSPPFAPVSVAVAQAGEGVPFAPSSAHTPQTQLRRTLTTTSHASFADSIRITRNSSKPDKPRPVYYAIQFHELREQVPEVLGLNGVPVPLPGATQSSSSSSSSSGGSSGAGGGVDASHIGNTGGGGGTGGDRAAGSGATGSPSGSTGISGTLQRVLSYGNLANIGKFWSTGHAAEQGGGAGTGGGAPSNSRQSSNRSSRRSSRYEDNRSGSSSRSSTDGDDVKPRPHDIRAMSTEGEVVVVSAVHPAGAAGNNKSKSFVFPKVAPASL
jgi:hypothetical protein